MLQPPADPHGAWSSASTSVKQPSLETIGRKASGGGGKHQKGGSVCLEAAKVNKEPSGVMALLTPSESHTGKHLVLSAVILVSYWFACFPQSTVCGQGMWSTYVIYICDLHMLHTASCLHRNRLSMLNYVHSDQSQTYKGLCVGFFFICVRVCPHECGCTVYMQCPCRPKEAVKYPETWVTGGCEPPCRCWGKVWVLYMNSQRALLTTEPSLQPLNTNF